MISEKEHFDRVAQAFSYKAGVYDAFGRDHPNLSRMRSKVYAHVLGFLQPGTRILEINAGTGADAVFFASRGFQVHATDIAPGMIASIQSKIDQYGLQGRLSAQCCSFTDLSRVEGKPFNYLFSNFGGLNCIEDLSMVTRQLPGVLAPGGYLTWVIMPPVCPWDLASAFKGDFRTALRRLRPGGTLANVEGVRFRVYYFTPGHVMHALGKDFRFVKLEGLSIFSPPADHKEFAQHSPGMYRLLARLDDRVSSLPVLRGWGDFFILTAVYRPC
ncbi:MAG: class I SAM-dependent methyltransferase [Omnitrophica WOR_2 bacterium]